MKCQHCHKREATVNWVGEGGMMNFIHGFYERWCEQCCLEAEVAYAEKHKNDLKNLRRKLHALQKKKVKAVSQKRKK
jgi:protein-arginine kinase activator protein McsA